MALFATQAPPAVLQDSRYMASIVPAIAWPYGPVVALGVLLSTIGAGLQVYKDCIRIA